MPLGNIIKLLLEVWEKISGESASVTNLPLKEDLPLQVLTENIEIKTTASTSDLLETTENTETEISLPRIFQERDIIKVSMLQKQLQNFMSSTAEVQGAILASPDGIALASVLSVEIDEERSAAMSASMLSLAEQIGQELVRGPIDRIIMEGEKGYGVLVSCSQEAVLLVLASAAAKQGVLFLEIKQVVAQITPFLD
ncbi:MAG: roadblock/LC7 domain-containing protein [Scytonema sp. PMC 1070.18]|nr:roadblock/LC7 domain-containing protein [Scytonema sp. PMC 1070.18]